MSTSSTGFNRTSGIWPILCSGVHTVWLRAKMIMDDMIRGNRESYGRRTRRLQAHKELLCGKIIP
eukprot:8021076-Pyramimonas_sp.AAC.2